MKKIILLISLFLYTNVNIAANFSEPNQEESTEISKATQIIIDSEVNQLLDTCINQLNHIAHNFEYLTFLANNGQSALTQKAEFLSYAQQMREIINSLKNNSFIVPELEVISKLADINAELCHNINLAIHKYKFTPIDLSLILKRSVVSDFNLDDLHTKIKRNARHINDLENQIDYFGLTFSQKMLRKCENLYQKSLFYIEDYKLENSLKYGSITLASSLYLLYLCPDLKKLNHKNPLAQLWHNRPVQAIKKVLGSRPEYDLSNLSKQDYHEASVSNRLSAIISNPKYEQPLLNSSELGLVGSFEYNFVNQLANTELSPAVLLPGLALGKLSYEMVENNMLANLGLYVSSNPVIRIMALTNHFLNIKNSERYHHFKSYWANYLKNKYQQLRGQSGQYSLLQKPTVTFNDIIGLEQAKKEFEPVIDYIINPDKFERSKLVPNKGYLMVGAPRTGKSFIAQAICGEINERQKILGKPCSANFITIDGGLVNEQNFKTNMYYINQNSPCIVFIDEIDLLALSRGNGQKENRLLSQLLTQMSGTIDFYNDEQNHKDGRQVIFIAATNNPHSLDAALLQAGRFGKIINFEYPKLDERKQFMHQELNKRAIFLDDHFIDSMCAELEGYSFQDISLIITGAIQKATSNYEPISAEHFKIVINEIIKGINLTPQNLSDQEKAQIACYQAGKALVSKLLMPSTNLSTVTTLSINRKNISKKNHQTIVDPQVEHGGIFTYKNHNLLDLKSSQELICECQILLAGHMAQELILGASCYNYRAQDQQAAFSIAKDLALEDQKYQELSHDIQQVIIQKSYDIKNSCKQKVKDLLIANQAKLNKIKLALEEKYILNQTELDQLLHD